MKSIPIKVITVFLTLLTVVACGDAVDSDSSVNGLESTLNANSTWPYEATGILDIVEAGYGDSDQPEWAVGMLVTDDDEFGVLIEIDGTVIASTGIDIDSGEPVRVWLESPTLEYGDKTYPITKIQVQP